MPNQDAEKIGSFIVSKGSPGLGQAFQSAVDSAPELVQEVINQLNKRT